MKGHNPSGGLAQEYKNNEGTHDMGARVTDTKVVLLAQRLTGTQEEVPTKRAKVRRQELRESTPLFERALVAHIAERRDALDLPQGEGVSA